MSDSTKKTKGVRRTLKGGKILIDYIREKSDVYDTFRSELKKGKLKGAKCKKCRKVLFPPPDYCPFCSNKINVSDFVDVPNSGRVLSQTTVYYMPAEDFSLTPPFSILAVKISRVDTVFILPTQRNDIYLGDRVKIFFKRPKERKGDITDLDLEKY